MDIASIHLLGDLLGCSLCRILMSSDRRTHPHAAENHRTEMKDHQKQPNLIYGVLCLPTETARCSSALPYFDLEPGECPARARFGGRLREIPSL
jgi:hypothetical protein